MIPAIPACFDDKPTRCNEVFRTTKTLFKHLWHTICMPVKKKSKTGFLMYMHWMTEGEKIKSLMWFGHATLLVGFEVWGLIIIPVIIFTDITLTREIKPVQRSWLSETYYKAQLNNIWQIAVAKSLPKKRTVKICSAYSLQWRKRSIWMYCIAVRISFESPGKVYFSAAPTFTHMLHRHGCFNR